MKTKVKISARDRARDKAVEKELQARYAHFVEEYGEDSAMRMTMALASLMFQVSSARNHMQARDMLVDIYNAAAAMHAVAQMFPK